MTRSKRILNVAGSVVAVVLLVGATAEPVAPAVKPPTPYSVTTTTTLLVLPSSDKQWEHETVVAQADIQSPPQPAAPVHSFRPSVEQWRTLVAQYFDPTHVDAALRVMRCESGGNPDAKNGSSTAAGLFQFLRGTWNWVATKIGLDTYESGAVYDPVANIRAAAWLSKGGTWWAHWQCQP